MILDTCNSIMQNNIAFVSVDTFRYNVYQCMAVSGEMTLIRN